MICMTDDLQFPFYAIKAPLNIKSVVSNQILIFYLIVLFEIQQQE
jgi:hypothetical protein